ncbi:autophagy-related protein 16 [Pseudoneurospora amorphoporcata]|uniref:Autophagy-related protein 16 n=1 Tax=Pseudoneurospora amorphoporcata TaxID=241081 RepID=A0AAN6SI67_9PEZI|nr:autophagy-related protein 16 [Pseudoneurospora amorphoporcata]
MPGWRDEYLSSLVDADQRNPVNRELVDTCQHLFDRISVLEAEKAALQQQVETYLSSSSSSSSAANKPRDRDTTKTDAAAADSTTTAPDAADSALLARLRVDLAEALRAKGDFQRRLNVVEEELVRLRTKTTTDNKTIQTLTTERKTLTIKLRDREEELRAKSKMLADVQDELQVLNTHLDLVEKRRSEMEAENKQLVARFMKRVGQEAEAMNMANDSTSGSGHRSSGSRRR